MKRILLVAVLPLFGVASCASSFPHRWYGLDAASYEGKLLGEEEKDDLPLHLCQPDDVTKGKCVVMLVDEFHRMREKYVELQEMLKACQEGSK
jgi:hypothetical protein